MKKQFLAVSLLVIIAACNLRPGGDRGTTSPDKILQLRLRPDSGADYNYNVTNETKTTFDVNDKTIENKTKTNYVVNYSVDKDTSGNSEVRIKYKEIHIYNKNNGEETEMDADNAANSSNPVEQMLGALVKARITATINPSGDVIKVDGYQEIASQYLSQINVDVSAKIAAQNQWKQLVEKSLVKNNMNRLFKIFPDSAVHIGDKWKMENKDEGDLNILVKNLLTLKSIEDGKAIVESSGHISSDSSAPSIMGYELNSSLKGVQKGEYEINIKSGMLENCNISANIEGTIHVVGRDIPINIDIKIKMKGSEN